MMTRIRPIPEAEWSEEARLACEHQRHEGGFLNLIKTLANHPKLARRWLNFANYILGRSTLPLRDREILILRIGWLCQSPYEWAQHVIVAKMAGLTDAEIKALKLAETAPSWNAHEALLIAATNELWGVACISEDTWLGLSRTYSDQQMMDLVCTVGQYNLVSMALNSFAVPLDEGIRGFEQ